MLRVDTRPRHRNAPRPAWKVAASYLQWLRGRPCAVANADCEGKIEAAHTPDPDSKGMGTKAADFTAVPLCAGHHRQQHQIGWDTFARRHGIKSINEWRRAYWFAWPGWKAWSREVGERYGK
jgi:hypothetical protein